MFADEAQFGAHQAAGGDGDARGGFPDRLSVAAGISQDQGAFIQHIYGGGVSSDAGLF